MKKRSGFLYFASLALLCVGCFAEQHGDLRAQKLGDVSHPARRRDTLAELGGACGSGELTAAGNASIRRAPYLQRVSDRAADLLWTQTGAGLATVEVTTPDGKPVASVSAGIHPQGHPAAGRQLVAHMAGLAPATVYCYEVRGQAGPLTARTGFRTAPSAGSGAPVRFIAFGDSGAASPDQYAVMEQMRTVPLDLILHTGDIAYESGTLQQFEDTFFAVYAPLLKSFPVFPASGNHDYETDYAGPFKQIFSLPRPHPETTWYSFDWGDVHFVVLDTERVGSQQAAWLDGDLGRNQLPWTIVYFHRPPFSSGTHGSSEAVRAALVPIFVKHKVPLVLNGHDHDYERTTPQQGVTYVVTGGGGEGTRGVGYSRFTAFSEAVLHFLYVDVEPERLTVHAIDGAGSEFDSVVIPRNVVN